MPGRYGTHRRRMPILIYNLSGAGSTVDASFVPPADLDYFWDGIVHEDGYDVLVTRADGITLQTHEFASYDGSNRSGTIEIDNIAIGTSDGVGVAWLYWDEDAASNRWTVFSPSSAKSCSLALYAPGEGDLVLSVPDPNDEFSAIADVIQKSNAQKLPVWIDLSAWFQPRQRAYNGSRGGDGPKYFTFKVQSDSQGTPDDETTMYDENDLRLIETEGGRLLVQVVVQAGTADSEYLGILTCGTASGFIREYRFQLNIINVTETVIP